jgi:uncharacterized membrane protein
MEEKMKFKKHIIASIIILVLTFLILNFGFAQTKATQAIIFPGVVEQISSDLNFIIVNEAKISLRSNTQVTDERGNSLTLYDLTRGSSISLQVVKQGSGFLAQKIVINKRAR